MNIFRTRIVVIGGVIAVAALLAVAAGVHSDIPARKDEIRHLEEGKASWYGPGFHGKTSASGVPFNQNAPTAAHKSLPLGSEATITNLENGKSVDVEINDRGPYVKGRKIDLSKEVARELEVIDDGTARVQIEVTREQLDPNNDGKPGAPANNKVEVPRAKDKEKEADAK